MALSEGGAVGTEPRLATAHERGPALALSDRFAPLVGLVGSTLFTLAAVVAALAYTGTAGEGYSPLNHWISELGEVGVSQLAAVFNVGLFVDGLALALFFAGLGLVRRSRLAWLYVPIGFVAGVSGALVGVFPMNEVAIHRTVALGFFNMGWIAVGLASLDIWRRPDARFPRWLPYLGGLTVLAFLGFLALYIPYLTGPDVVTARPAVSVLITLEWSVLAGIVAWTFAASLSWWREVRGLRPLD